MGAAMAETLTDAQGAKCFYAPFSEVATPSSYVWELALPDAYIAAVKLMCQPSWSCATGYFEVAVNGVLYTDVPVPPETDNWTVAWGAREVTTNQLVGNTKMGDVMRFTCKSIH